MHTCAHLLQYSGRLLAPAQVRTRVLDGDAHSVPVVTMHIELDNDLHSQMHVEQPFPVGHFKQASAAANRLKKGTHISVDVTLLDIELVARNAAHIHVIPDQPQETSEPCLL